MMLLAMLSASASLKKYQVITHLPWAMSQRDAEVKSACLATARCRLGFPRAAIYADFCSRGRRTGLSPRPWRGLPAAITAHLSIVDDSAFLISLADFRG